MRYRLASALLVGLLVLSLFVGCNKAEPEQGAVPEGQSAPSPTDTGLLDDILFSQEETTTIALSGTSAEIDGTGATLSGGTLTLTDSRRYVLSGDLTGSVVIDATKDDLVEIVLDGVTVTAIENAAIYAKKQDLLVITLAAGSTNSLTDAGNYTYADDAAEEPDAALFSKNDLTIRGSGSLTVSASFNNGIGSKDDLVIEGGTLAVMAANHGIRGRDSVTIHGGTFDITAGNDGLQSNNGGDGKGWIAILGGNFTIAADRDGIQAESDLTIEGGVFQITAGGGSDATAVSGDESYKGLKAGANIVIEDGTFDLDCADDGIHANGDITIAGAAITIATGDDGIHADGHLEISGGTIDITKSYEGLEATTMTLAGGRIDIVASDDGINIAGGKDSSGFGGRFGGGSSGSTDDRWMNITGGTITVNAQGDGLDSNGNITMSGGYVVVHGPTSGADAAIDFDGSFTITGGTLIGVGSSGMAQAPGGDSAQQSLQLYLSSTYPAGSLVTVTDASGSSLIEITTEKNIQNIVFSSSDLALGETYTVSVGDATFEVTLTDVATRISDTGEAVSGMFGFGGMGGNRGGSGGGTPPGGDRPTGGPGGDGERFDMPDGGPPEGMTGGPGGGRPGGMGGTTPPDGDPPSVTYKDAAVS